MNLLTRSVHSRYLASSGDGRLEHHIPPRDHGLGTISNSTAATKSRRRARHRGTMDHLGFGLGRRAGTRKRRARATNQGPPNLKGVTRSITPTSCLMQRGPQRYKERLKQKQIIKMKIKNLKSALKWSRRPGEQT